MPGTGHADVLYSDEAVTMSWPSEITHVPCEPELASRAGVACIRLGDDGSLGAVFVTRNAGYALGSEALLEAHLRQSEEALADIPRVHVMQSRVLRVSPLVGLMEVLRKDGTLSSVAGLNGRAIRQSAFLIPAGDCLYQVFIYLPVDGEDALYIRMIESFEVQVRVAPSVPEVQDARGGGSALDLLPLASVIGAAVALGVILGLCFRARRRRSEKEAAFLREASRAGEARGDFDLSMPISGAEDAENVRDNSEVCDFDPGDADSVRKNAD
ncbi:MAG: hypothetical protein IKY83_11760 [Proteobacteria bacterium]|nr:hypothetical protein [Pseudomonadota bacterium]